MCSGKSSEYDPKRPNSLDFEVSGTQYSAIDNLYPTMNDATTNETTLSSTDSSQAEIGIDGASSNSPSTSAPPPPAPPPPLLEFIPTLVQHFSKDELFEELRVSSRGLFLHESLLEKITTAFGQFLSSRGDNTSSQNPDKVRRKLFGTEHPQHRYLVEGKLCIPGYLAPAELPENEKYPIAYFKGMLLDTASYLHPRDPYLEALPDLRTNLKSTGFSLSLQVKGRNYNFDPSFLTDFAGAAKDSKRLRQEFPLIRFQLRAAIPALARILDKARKQGGRAPMLVPGEYRDAERYTIVGVRNLSVVVESERKLVAVFGSEGRSLHALVTSEFDKLKTKKPRKLAKEFRFDGPDRPGRRSKSERYGKTGRGKKCSKNQNSRRNDRNRERKALGSIRSNDGILAVEPRALKTLHDLILSPEFKQELLNGLFDIEQALNVFVAEYLASAWLIPTQIPHVLVEAYPKGTNFRATKNLIFVLRGTNSISAVHSRKQPSLMLRSDRNSKDRNNKRTDKNRTNRTGKPRARKQNTGKDKQGSKGPERRSRSRKGKVSK